MFISKLKNGVPTGVPKWCPIGAQSLHFALDVCGETISFAANAHDTIPHTTEKRSLKAH